MSSTAKSLLPRHSPSPILLSLALFFAILTCSSAGVAFAFLSSYGVPAALAASWRLWCCEIIQLIPFLISTRQIQKKEKSKIYLKEWKETTNLLQSDPSFYNSDDSKEEDSTEDQPKELFFPRYLKAMPYMILSGICLGVHFSAWVYSIEKTTLFHSLLFVSMGPMVLHGGHWFLIWTRPLLVLMWTIPEINRPSQMESMGVLIGIIGTMFVLLDLQPNPNKITSTLPKPTLEGDFAAFIGAIAVSIYLVIGRSLRPWIPLWMYTFPVIGFAIFTSVGLAFVLEQDDSPVVWTGDPSHQIFGFLWEKNFFWISLYLGAGPGVCGHTLINGLLKYISPLTVSTALLTEPIFGSVLGYWFGYQQLPHWLSCLGGMVLLLGLGLIVLGESGCHSFRDAWNQLRNKEKDITKDVDSALHSNEDSQSYGTLE